MALLIKEYGIYADGVSSIDLDDLPGRVSDAIAVEKHVQSSASSSSPVAARPGPHAR